MLAKQALYCLSHSSSLFCSDYFRGSISQSICQGWVLNVILLISASKVARIIDGHEPPSPGPILAIVKHTS
jgi:hypothetical protein